MEFAALLVLFVSASAMQTSMYVKRSGLADLKSSASGFTYHGSEIHPVSYMYFSNNPNFKPQPLRVASIPEIKPLPLLLAEPNAELVQDASLESKEDVEVAIDETSAALRVPEDEEHYEEETGEENDAAYRSEKGEKGNAGYDKLHNYDVGRKGSFEKENHKGHYAQNGGDKKGYHESTDGYQSEFNDSKASKGGNFEVSGYRKKGQKTTGYHRVYHKDEYKKDHTFYDESDKKGHYSKYGNFHNNHKAELGGHKEGGNSASGFQNNLYGKQGFVEKGKNEEESAGHDRASGRETYESEQEKYGKKGDSNEHKEHGYSVKE